MLLKNFGYKIDEKGNIYHTNHLITAISIEETPEGGILRVHRPIDSFFYNYDLEDNLFFPEKISKKYVYFRNKKDEKFKVRKKEFEEKVIEAMINYKESFFRQIAG